MARRERRLSNRDLVAPTVVAVALVVAVGQVDDHTMRLVLIVLVFLLYLLGLRTLSHQLPGLGS
jgi:fatty acid desaturase